MVVIAAVDDDEQGERVVAQANTLAEAFDDEVHAIHVLTRSQFVDLERTSMDTTGSAMDLDRIRAVAADIATEQFPAGETDVTPVGIVGDPATSIIEYADDHDARYVVVGGRKRSPAGKAVFGSVSHDVIMNARSPTVITSKT